MIERNFLLGSAEMLIDINNLSIYDIQNKNN
jgi:hypothetical protein